MSTRRHRSALALAGLVAACGGSGGFSGPEVERQSAQPLGTIARALPPDDRAQAREALRQDAWRREHRFLDAVSPGHLFRSTRVRQVEILLHGGEALASRDAYARLDDAGRAPLRVFLASMVRARRLVAE